MSNIWRKLFGVFSVCLLTCFIFIAPAISASDEVKTAVSVGPVQQVNPYYSTQTVTYSDGTSLTGHIISGPPKPPAGFEAESQAVVLPDNEATVATALLTVPTYNWVFGCSAVSGAMIAGYYDRNGYPGMYTGPANGGVAPLDHPASYWGTWTDVNSDTYPNNPLVASHNGIDGRVTKGSIDDYWIEYGSSANDPYITGAWTQHTWKNAIGDYMKTSQSIYDLGSSITTDGSTWFWTSGTSGQLTCAAMASTSDGYGHMISWSDGTYGRKLFYEARGYTVTTCYNQSTDNRYSGGFSFAQYKAEIDAGRPVMLNLDGHTIVGVGYSDPSTVYLHDTWHKDGSTQSMTWGTSYSGMTLLSVSIVNLAAFVADTTPSAFAFTDRTNVALNTEFKSNAITVAGINTAAPISVVGGRYSINGDAYTTASGTVIKGDTVKVRKISANASSTTKSATLTIGGVSDTFSVTTMVGP